MLKDFVPVLQRMSISLSTHGDTVEFESLDLQTKLSEVESWSKKRLSAWIVNHGNGTSKSGNRCAVVNRSLDYRLQCHIIVVPLTAHWSWGVLSTWQDCDVQASRIFTSDSKRPPA